MRKRRGGWDWGDRAQCHRGTQRDGWQRDGSKLGRPGGKRRLINGRRFGPNIQLVDLTNCSVSTLPFFFMASYNVCPQLVGGGEV